MPPSDRTQCDSKLDPDPDAASNPDPQVAQLAAHTGAAAPPVTAAFMDSYRRKDDSKGYRCLNMSSALH